MQKCFSDPSMLTDGSLCNPPRLWILASGMRAVEQSLEHLNLVQGRWQVRDRAATCVGRKRNSSSFSSCLVRSIPVIPDPRDPVPPFSRLSGGESSPFHTYVAAWTPSPESDTRSHSPAMSVTIVSLKLETCGVTSRPFMVMTSSNVLSLVVSFPRLRRPVWRTIWRDFTRLADRSPAIIRDARRLRRLWTISHS